ncbi:MAG: hypothetical protein JWL69_3633 [Phycisphaerales bacterium]|nr:hypothetical protein [Phycisphaerales bacterium]
MQLKPATERALNAWLGPSTWHTPHECDMDRWYDFVNLYQRDHGYSIDEPALREHIEKKVGGHFSDEENGLRSTIRKRISLAYSILDFLKRTKR